MKVSWRKLPTVLLEEEILDKAFSRAKKAADRVDDSDRVFRVRKQMNRMVQTAADIIATTFQDTVNTWPSLDQSPQFDISMIDACVGCDDYRHHLSMLQWGGKQVLNIAGQNSKKIVRTGRTELMHDARREAYGRISSIMRRVGPSLTWLSQARETLKRLPTIDQLLPCIVVCGAPNVGKSAFISALSSGNMEVNHYPFTTKQIHVGHFNHRRLQYQLVDTPGLLDRPLEKRNAIELQAIAALENIGSLVLFLMDESEACGTPIEEQEHLLEDVQKLLPGTDLMIVTSKADLLKPLPENWDEVHAAEQEWRDEGSEGEPELPLLCDPKGRVTMSATEFVGMDSMRLEIVRRVKVARPNNPLELPEGWYRRDLDQ
ncbi:MAG: GTP-binding protein [Euryarchaeota archaeon]|jgi:nucleolar GTP-binding protein|nr:GTP-binding protein [Euryarchaeota archaeon]MBT5594629.1 GTP-binding protein [Euryarchaeota archaeon]MBT5843712.1 GTP-binding protein [Euryarchaeota archaeon]MBT6641305.1 GTP-binding protein [Euryarchaeota archaeon]MBT7064376.1 GTP-binding protein [Euryarchaeota archaeon]